MADVIIRPVVKGTVIAVHVPLPAGDSWDEKLPSLIFYSSADIKADGTFEFASMPQSGTVQLIAVCDGWVGLQEEKSPFIVGQTFDVLDSDLDIVLEMTRTFDANIRVVDKDGKPVEGITAGYSPNQFYKRWAGWIEPSKWRRELEVGAGDEG